MRQRSHKPCGAPLGGILRAAEGNAPPLTKLWAGFNLPHLRSLAITNLEHTHEPCGTTTATTYIIHASSLSLTGRGNKDLCPKCISVFQILQITTFPYLTALNLDDFSIDRQQLTSTLNHFAPQLRALTLANIRLTTGTWQPVFYFLRRFHHLLDVKFKDLLELGPFQRTRPDGHGTPYLLARGTPYLLEEYKFFARSYVIFGEKCVLVSF
ncbi:hypothetical protein CC86DRAFT_454223 [Ophiobolus disseminans]|uniref:Uncharacterized protein n=1 Tax=Ophiobolus disseminans TaxID=1469910 RepID=A0A6A7A6K8_9PLEO|nr:hypothetical protein CC86DRAFT_454223 [Ophiobolus disseminans]